MFIRQCPDNQTDRINWVISRQEKIGQETKHGDRDERQEIVLCKSKVKGDFFSEMVFDGIQLGVRNSPFARPRLNPFLMSSKS